MTSSREYRSKLNTTKCSVKLYTQSRRKNRSIKLSGFMFLGQLLLLLLLGGISAAWQQPKRDWPAVDSLRCRRKWNPRRRLDGVFGGGRESSPCDVYPATIGAWRKDRSSRHWSREVEVLGIGRPLCSACSFQRCTFLCINICFHSFIDFISSADEKKMIFPARRNNWNAMP